MVTKFICGFCGKFTGTRKGLRQHLGKNHLRKEYFNTNGMGDRGIKKLSRDKVIREDWP